VAYQVAAHSVWTHATAPVSITRLDLSKLPLTRRGLTEFTYSRFLVPYLSGFEGVSIFLDSDVLVRGDIVELLGYQLAYPGVPVLVVKHERTFERPSVMVFHNPSCANLTPEFVEDQTNKLFDFKWARTIGDLPKDWNHLVGYDAPNPDAKLVHFTMGIPIWEETKRSEFAEEWKQMVKQTLSSVSFAELMGRSVHVPHLAKVGG
jgi:hypothetical protein